MRPLLIHGPAEAAIAAEAALTIGDTVHVISEPGAGGNGGPGWFLALIAAATAQYPGAKLTGILDCADQPGAVMASLRAGCTHLIFTGPNDTTQRLAEMAQASGAVLLTARPEALSLRGRRDALPYALNWLRISL